MIPKKKYIIEIIIKGTELCKHIIHEDKLLDFEFNDGINLYNIKKVDLYRLTNISLMRRIKLKLKRVMRYYYIVFNDGKSEAIRVNESVVNPKVLKLINDSRALERGIKSEFKEAIEGRKMIFILIVITVAIVIVLYATGGLKMLGVNI